MKTNIRRFPISRTLFSYIVLLLLLGAPVLRVSAADKTWDGGGADGFWRTDANWVSDARPSAGDTLLFGGSARLNVTNDYAAGTLFSGINFSAPAGGFTLYGNQITLGGNLTNNQVVVTETINLPLALNATRDVNVVTDGALTLGGVISGAGFGLTKGGDGLLTLGAVNTFSGPVTINGGTVSVAADNNLGAEPGLATPGSIVINDGTLRSTATFTLAPNRGIALGATSGSGSGTINVLSGNTLTYRGVIANPGGGGGLLKSGFGGLTLSGSNTYTGPTLIKNGTATLDFTQPTAPINDIINPVSALTLGGANAGFGATNFAALIMNGKASTVNSQTFNGVNVTFGGSVIRATSGAGGAANLALGALGHDPGGVLVMVPPALVGGSGNLTTTATNINGILGGFATVGDGSSAQGIVLGTNFASVDASGNVVNFSDYRALAMGEKIHSISPAGANLLISSTVTGDLVVDDDNANTVTDVNAINWNRTDNSVTLGIGAGNTLRLGRYGSIFKPNTTSGLTWLIGQTAGGANGPDQDIGTLTAGGADNTPGEIIVNVNNTSSSSGTIIIDSKITDNGTGPVTFVKTGVGSMKLRGHNTHSGGTFLLQGRVQFVGGEGGVGTGNADAGGTGPIYILPGCYLFPSGTAPTTPVTNAVFIAGSGTAGEPLGAIRTTAGWLFNGPWTLIGDTTIGGNGGASGGIAARLSGPYALTLCSPITVNGSVCLSNPSNDWSGTTTLSARLSGGTVPHNNTFLSGDSEVIPNGFGKGNVVMAGGVSRTITWNLNGYNETVNGLLTSGTGESCLIVNNGATPAILTVGDNDQSATFGGIIQDGSGPVALTKIGGGAQTLTGANTYTGDTIVNGGTLMVSGSGSVSSSANILVNSGATLDVSGVTGGFTYPGALTVSNGQLVARTTVAPISALSLVNTRVRVTTLGTVPNVDVTTLTTGGATNLIDVLSVGTITSYPAQFTIIKYGSLGGAGFNFALGTVPGVSTIGYVSNDTANASVVLVLTAGPKALTWTGASNGNWDIATTTNWLAFGTTPSIYQNIDAVRFDDSASITTVNLTTALIPGALVVNNPTKNYSFIGSGRLAGLTDLVKDGAGTLILDNSGVNDYSGVTEIANGTLQIGANDANGNLPAGSVVNNGTLVFSRSNDLVVSSAISGTGPVTQNGAGVLSLNGASTYDGQTTVSQGTLRTGSGTALGSTVTGTIVSSGATLDVGGQSLGIEAITVSGTGVGGQGAIVNSGADNINALSDVTLAGDTTFGGSGRWGIRITGGLANLLTGGSPFKLTKVGANQFSLVGVNVDSALADVNVQQGLFSVETSTTSLGNPASPLTVAAGATLQFYSTTSPFDKLFVLNGDGITTTVNNGAGANTLVGQVTLNGNCLFNAGGTSLTLGGPVGGSGGLTKNGNSLVIISGNATYAGSTIVYGGTLAVDGSLANSSGITVNGGALGGVGAINVPVTIAANGTLAPGNALITPTATLSVNNTLNLSGTTAMDVIKLGGALSGDRVQGVTQLTLGGTLQINLDTNSEPLAVGDSIKLFNFASASGAFATMSPAPGEGLDWDASNLAQNGTLAVKVKETTAAAPQISKPTLSGSNLIITGSGGTPNTSYVILTSTNVALPKTNWLPAASILFDANGNFNYTNAVDANTPQRFFRLQWQ